ncbi:MAG: radical SAM protein [Cetobacterium sp.]
MKYTGPIYRPPFEANSLLLQVTVGCSHNKCTFCSMYRDVKFCTESIEQIEKDLLEARELYPIVKRVFLVNADPFVLNATKLKEIAKKINQILPEVETIAMYASISNIKDKTDEELKELRALKINDLNIGIESGLNEVVKKLNKGFTIDEAKKQLARLNSAGIDFSINIIIGAAGAIKSKENALANANFLNEVKPNLIFIATLHVDPGSKIEEEMLNGNFIENNVGENIKEELLMLQNLNLEKTFFFGLHTSNVIPVYGFLGDKKEEMIQDLLNGLSSLNEEYLNKKPTKDSEGRIIK